MAILLLNWIAILLPIYLLLFEIMKKTNKSILTMLLALTVGVPSVNAAVTLPSFFTDNMVLQQQNKVKIWGTSTAKGQKLVLTSSWNNKTYETAVDANGNWSIDVETIKFGGPYQITINDGDLFTLNNILLGDVWFCSGQSNMEMPLAGWGQIDNYNEEIKNANYPNIRILQVAKATANQPQEAVKVDFGGWNAVTPASIPEFSSTAYFFAREVYTKTGVPIGLIHSSWGGTIIESWLSKNAFVPFKQFEKTVARISDPNAAELYEKDMQEWLALAEKQDVVNLSNQGKWYNNRDWSGWKTIQIPSFFDSDVFPGLDGVVYFTKEVTLPKNWKGKALKLVLGPIDDNDITYVNGSFVGETNGFTTPRNYTVSKEQNNSDKLRIMIRVYDGAGGGGIYGGGIQPHIEGPNGEQLSLVGEWNTKVGIDFRNLPAQPVALEGPNRPTVLYNAMVNPFIDYKISGVIWYQGESNAEKKQDALLYKELLPALITDWRSKWNNANMPFYFVQLANYKAKTTTMQPSLWAVLRDAQRNALTLPNTGMAVIADIGDATDIHPKNKQEVGRRLGLIAVNQHYAKKGAYSGPTVRNWKMGGSTIAVTFNTKAKKLVLKDIKDATASFYIAGEDQQFYPAQVSIKGNVITLSAKEVAKPIAVRYAWSDNPDLVLFNDAGLPASPFRTDNWNAL